MHTINLFIVTAHKETVVSASPVVPEKDREKNTKSGIKGYFEICLATIVVFNISVVCYDLRHNLQIPGLVLPL
jgi:hypothetical protein